MRLAKRDSLAAEHVLIHLLSRSDNALIEIREKRSFNTGGFGRQSDLGLGLSTRGNERCIAFGDFASHECRATARLFQNVFGVRIKSGCTEIMRFTRRKITNPPTPIVRH